MTGKPNKLLIGPQACEMDQLGRTLGEWCGGDFETPRLSLVIFQRRKEPLEFWTKGANVRFTFVRLDSIL